MYQIGLISDPHACLQPVEQALQIFHQQGVDAIWCAGDIAGYGTELTETLSLLRQHDCQLVVGNHELEYLQIPAQAKTEIGQVLQTLPHHYQAEIEGKKIYMVHAAPPDDINGGIRLLDKQGRRDESAFKLWQQELSSFDYDILIVGHTHQVFAETLSGMLVVNPGSCRYNHSCAILKLPSCELEWYALSGKSIIKSWHWGLEVGINNSL